VIEFHLDARSGVPTYLQLVQQVRQAVRLGILRRRQDDTPPARGRPLRAEQRRWRYSALRLVGPRAPCSRRSASSRRSTSSTARSRSGRRSSSAGTEPGLGGRTALDRIEQLGDGNCLLQNEAGYLHAVYHPANRFWLLQGIETALFGGTAVAL